MATNFLDPIQERAFREKASQYYTPAEIDSYVSKRKGFSQEVQLYSEGKLPSESLTADTREKYSIEAAKTGLALPKEKNEKQETANSLTTAAQSVLDTINLIESGKLTGKAAEDALNFAAGQSYKSTFDTAGKQLTGAELAILQGTNPTVQQTKGNIVQRVGGFVTGQVPPQTGKVVDDLETLKRKMNLAVEYSKAIAEGRQPNIEAGLGLGEQSEVPEKPPSLGGLVENATTDIGEIISGTADIAGKAFRGFSPGAIMFSEEEKGKARNELIEVAKGLPAAIIEPYRQLLTNPVEYAYKNPVDAVLALVPFAHFLKGAKVAKASTVGKSVTKSSSVSQKVGSGISKIVETVESPGSKEFIAKNMSREAPQNIYKTLFDEGVFRAVSPKGVIENTQKALNSVGDDLAQVYGKSPVTYTTDRIRTGVEQISDQFPMLAGVQDDVIRSLEKSGKFDMASGITTLKANDVWKIAKDLREFGRTALDIGESGKPVAAFAERLESLLRKQLAYDIPDTAPLAVRYGNLKEFFDLIDDPKPVVGANGLARITGRLNAALDFVKSLTERGLQVGYDLLPETPPDIVPPKSGKPPIPEISELLPTLNEVVRPRKPLPASITSQVVNKKGVAQSERLKGDFPSSFGTEATRESQESMLRRAGKKRYK